MQEPIDFNELMTHVDDTRSFLDEAAAIMVGEQKEQFQNLLGLIDTNVAQMKTAVPASVAAFEAKYHELAEKHEDNLKNFETAKQSLADVKQQIADGTLPVPQAPPETPTDPKLGSKLRDEILAKFMPKQVEQNTQSGVAWQDWNLNGNWLPGNPDVTQ
ncbi:MAG: hypothetical protein AB8B55_13330 [Mariniblastus sp.]